MREVVVFCSGSSAPPELRRRMSLAAGSDESGRSNRSDSGFNLRDGEVLKGSNSLL